MAQRKIPERGDDGVALDAKAYSALRREVGRLLEPEARGRGEAETERLLRYWEAGGWIEAVLPGSGRAGYGDEVLAQLAEDLDIRKRLLYEMLRLRRLFPKVPTSAQLGWSHYRVLLGVAARRARSFYVKHAEQHGWSVRQLELHVQQGLYEQTSGEGSTDLPQLPRGRLYTYMVSPSPFPAPVSACGAGEPPLSAKPPGEGLRLDMGFRLRVSPALVDLGDAEPGQVVATRPGDGGQAPYRAVPSDAGVEETYTYIAQLRRVVDGDTLEVTLDLGFGIELEETIRLRGIDAPEMPTERGIAARDFVMRTLAEAPRLVVTTRYPDRYGRYLGDVWYLDGVRDGRKIAAQGSLLNGELVEAGLAARYRR